MPGVKEKSSGMGDRVRSTVSGASEKISGVGVSERVSGVGEKLKGFCKCFNKYRYAFK